MQHASDIIVMKFGGTSVATAEGRQAILRRVQRYIDVGAAPVVVVSAMGRRGDPYATDTLLGLVEGMPTNPQEQDWLASIGEDISALVIAHELRAGGVNAVAMSGPSAGLHACGEHGSGQIHAIDVSQVLSALESGRTPVVCGFQALSSEGQVITLGRGGSDTSACALGAALNCHCVEIYTDVDGVMTSDPRVVADAQVLHSIRADELFQMAKMGSKVVHAPAAELALSSGVPLFVRNTFTDHPGTRVVRLDEMKPSAVATAIASTSDVVRFRVGLGSPSEHLAHMKAQTAVYEALAAAEISLDMFTPCGDVLLLTVSSASRARCSSVLSELGAPFEEQQSLAKVTVIGAGMHGVPGVMARIARALYDAQVDVEQAADSHTTISVLVQEQDALTAVRALHSAFGLTDR